LQNNFSGAETTLKTDEAMTTIWLHRFAYTTNKNKKMNTKNESALAGYISAAEAVFQKMLNLLESNSIWPVGNASDTMLDYLMLVGKYDERFISTLKNCFEEGKPAWYDDYVWPALAAMKAYDSRYKHVFDGSHSLNSSSSYFRSYAIKNWNDIFNGVPVSNSEKFGTQNVWDRIQHDKEWAGVKPRFFGGTWQCDITTESDPGKTDLGPFQVSVMNGLFLQFSGMLMELKGQFSEVKEAVTDQAGKANAKQKSFLVDWFGQSSNSHNRPDFKNSLFKFSSEKDFRENNIEAGILVRERVSTYAGTPGNYPPVNEYNPERIWIGDQGLMLGGLLNSEPDSITDIKLMRGIINGVINSLYKSGKTQLKSRLGSWSNIGCPDCYNAGGGGIFMRNLLPVLMDVPEIRSEFFVPGKHLFFVNDLANQAVKGPITPEDSPQNLLFVYMDQLATLNVAIYLQQQFALPGDFS
jgi:hypothetical protein